MSDISVTVEVDFVEDKSNIFVKQPADQKLEINELAKVLAGGLMLCIRLDENSPVLMKEIIDYMNHEFIDNESFKDAKHYKINP